MVHNAVRGDAADQKRIELYLLTLGDRDLSEDELQRLEKTAAENKPNTYLLPIVIVVFTLITVVLFLLWLYKVRAILSSTINHTFRFSPSLAIWSFFIPVVNLWYPILVLSETWNTCYRKSQEKSNKVPLVMMWWITFVVSIAPITPVLFKPIKGVNPLELLPLFYWGIATNVLAVLAAVLGVVIVYSINQALQNLVLEPSFVEIPNDIINQDSNMNLRAMEITNRGFRYYQEGNIEQAITTFEEVIKSRPDWLSAYTALAVCYREKGRFQEALEILEKFLALSKDPVIVGQMNLLRWAGMKSVGGGEISDNVTDMVESTKVLMREIKAQMRISNRADIKEKYK